MTNDATTNVGFKGPITSAQTPLVLGRASRYAIQGTGDLKVTATGGTRALSVALGAAWGDGVLSTWSGSTSPLTGTAVASSGYRYDTVYIRRTWQPATSPTGKAEIVLVTGTATRGIYGRTTQAGVTGQTSDQPLALVRFDYGSNAVTEIIDLRVWAGEGGGLYANTIEALQYLTDPGTTVRVQDVQYTRVVNPSTGAVSWAVDDMGALRSVFPSNDGSALIRFGPTGVYGTGMQVTVNDVDNSFYAQKPATGGPDITFRVNSSKQIDVGNLAYSHLNGEVAVTTGFGTNMTGFAKSDGTLYRRGDHRELFLEVRAGANLTVGSTGAITDRDLFTIASGDKPRGTIPLTISYRGSTNQNIAIGDLGSVVTGFGRITSGGVVKFTQGAPGWNVIGFSAESGETSFFIHAEWGV